MSVTEVTVKKIKNGYLVVYYEDDSCECSTVYCSDLCMVDRNVASVLNRPQENT